MSKAASSGHLGQSWAAKAIGVSPDGSIWLAVDYQGGVNFGDGAQVNQGGWDAAIVHFAAY